MKKTITPKPLGGEVNAIPSKSYAHRLLICAAFSHHESEIFCDVISEDIEATIRCLRALGADITETDNMIKISPIDRNNIPENPELDCGESGSTLRFMLPVVCALGCKCTMLMRGRLPERPLSPLYEELKAHGAVISGRGTAKLSVSGKLDSSDFEMSGDVSSQFITGLLFAMPLIDGGGSILLKNEIQSAPYVYITVECLKESNIDVIKEGDYILLKGDYDIPQKTYVQGDWSNAAFWLVAGAVGDNPISVRGLDTDTAQGDRKILDILEEFGAKVEDNYGEFTVYPSKLHGIDVDAKNILDLIPIVSVLGMKADGETIIKNAERLRFKESDRLRSVCNMLKSFGVDYEERRDGMKIKGGTSVHGCVIDPSNDHRIAMAAAIAAMMADSSVTILDSQCVNKSYPLFFEVYENLGGIITGETDT